MTPLDMPPDGDLDPCDEDQVAWHCHLEEDVPNAMETARFVLSSSTRTTSGSTIEEEVARHTFRSDSIVSFTTQRPTAGPAPGLSYSSNYTN